MTTRHGGRGTVAEAWERGAAGGCELGARWIAGLAGGVLLAYGVRRRGPLGALLGTLGFGLLSSGVTNRGAVRLLTRGLRAGVAGVPAFGVPEDRVFEFWNHYENDHESEHGDAEGPDPASSWSASEGGAGERIARQGMHAH